MTENQFLEEDRIELLSKCYALVTRSRQAVRHLELKLGEAQVKTVELREALSVARARNDGAVDEVRRLRDVLYRTYGATRDEMHGEGNVVPEANHD